MMKCQWEDDNENIDEHNEEVVKQCSPEGLALLLKEHIGEAMKQADHYTSKANALKESVAKLES